MIVHGIDLNQETDALFPDAQSGRVLILDGDALAYKAAATRKTIDGAFNQFLNLVLTEKFLTNSESVRCHLTSNGNLKAFRNHYPTAKPYQANRSKKMPPPLLRPLRDYLTQPLSAVPENIEILVHTVYEADDHILMDAEQYKESGLVWSEDKDMRQTRYPYWNIELGIVEQASNGGFGEIIESATEGGQFKVKGSGTKFFWYQMLAGDTADNVKGINKLNGKNCGDKGAFKYILPFQDEDECANAVLWEYANTGQDVLAEAQMLWLKRSEFTNAYHYLMGLGLHPDLRKWVQGLHDYHAQVMGDYFEKANPEPN